MFQTNSSPFAGLARVIMTLVVIGIVLGLALAGTDLTNFITNSAKADAIRRQNEIDTQRAEIDIQNYQAIERTKTQVEIDKLLADSTAYNLALDQKLQSQAQQAALDLEISRLISYCTASAIAFLALCAGVGILILITRYCYVKLGTTQLQTVKNERWEDLAYRKHQIRLSRQRERATRSSVIDMSASRVPCFTNQDLFPWTAVAVKEEYIGIKK